MFIIYLYQQNELKAAGQPGKVCNKIMTTLKHTSKNNLLLTVALVALGILVAVAITCMHQPLSHFHLDLPSKN